jgi:MFS family permease
MPCYATGAICYLLVAWYSDRIQLRGPFASVAAFISATGYAILVGAGLTDAGPGVLYFGCFVAASGMYIILGLNIAWLNTNNPLYGKRATASGMQIMLGNIPGVISPWLYTNSDQPLYITGHATCLALVALAGFVHAGMYMYLTRENKLRADGKRDHLIEGKTEEEIREMGDKSPRFVYTT